MVKGIGITTEESDMERETIGKGSKARTKNKYWFSLDMPRKRCGDPCYVYVEATITKANGTKETVRRLQGVIK